MKKAKTWMQGAFLALLFLLSLVTTVYSAYTLHRLRLETETLEFIDLAAQSVERANLLLERQDQYATMRTVSIIALVITALLFTLWLLLYLRRLKRERPPEVAAYTESEQTTYECPNCHRVYNMPVAFCGVCGAKMQED